MLREFWLKIRFKRADAISEKIKEDLKWFLDLNYISEEAVRESTAALYDASDLSVLREQGTDNRLPGDEEVTESSEPLPTETDGYPSQYSYSSGSTGGYIPYDAFEINESECEIAEREIKDFQSISGYRQSYEFEYMILTLLSPCRVPARCQALWSSPYSRSRIKKERISEIQE